MSQSPAIRSSYRPTQQPAELSTSYSARKHTRSGVEYDTVSDGSSSSAPFVPTMLQTEKIQNQRSLYSIGVIMVLLVIFGSWFFPQRHGSSVESGNVAECSALQREIVLQAEAQATLADGQKSVEIRLGELKAAAKSLAYNVGLLSDNKQFGGYNFNEVCQNGAVDTSLEAQRGLQELHELLLRKDEHFREEYDVALSQVQALRVELTSVVEAQKEYIGVLTSQIAELSMALETERRLNHELTTMLNSCVTEDAIDSMVSGRLDSIDMEKIQGYGADSICFTSQEALKEAVDLTVRSDIARLNHLIKESTNVEIQEVLKLIREAEATRLEHLREQDLVTSRDPTTSCDKCITIGEAKSMIHEEVAEQFSTQHKCEKIAASPPVLSTAEPDHAQRGAGAIVMHEFTSATYLRPRDRGSAADVFASVLDSMSDYFGIENGIGRPEDALSHRVTLGQCWAMNGTHGVLTIQLAHPVHVTSVTVDHVSRHEAIDVSSAPKDFEVFGLQTLESPRRLIVRGSYDISGPRAQTFRPAPAGDADEFEESLDAYRRSKSSARTTSNAEYVRFVSLRIRSNHGNPNYTCLYRFRVHGDAVSPRNP